MRRPPREREVAKALLNPIPRNPALGVVDQRRGAHRSRVDRPPPLVARRQDVVARLERVARVIVTMSGRKTVVAPERPATDGLLEAPSNDGGGGAGGEQRLGQRHSRRERRPDPFARLPMR